MESITLTEAEVAYIVHYLSKYYFDEDIARVIRLLSGRFIGKENEI